MPSRVDQLAETLAREAARRRAVDLLSIASATADYAARQLADGLGPAEARRAAVEAAGELEHIAGQLRKLTRPGRIDPADRRALAVELVGDGMSQRQIAARLGVTKKVIWDDLRRAGWVYPGSPRY